jgi:nucleoid-associated protein YgaU
VAVQVLAEAGAANDDGEVVRYWLRLIEANTDRLADPANPDLIFPGQVFALPIHSPAAERAQP